MSMEVADVSVIALPGEDSNSRSTTPEEPHHELRVPSECGEMVDTVAALCSSQSMSSDDSFYSASEENEEHQLYMSAMALVGKGAVQCRKNR